MPGKGLGVNGKVSGTILVRMKRHEAVSGDPKQGWGHLGPQSTELRVKRK